MHTPAQVLLAPLAWLLTLVMAAGRRPSLVIALSLALVLLPSSIQGIAGGQVTPPDMMAALAVLIIACRIMAGYRITNRFGWLPFAALVFALAVATLTGTDVLASSQGFVRNAELFLLIPIATAMSMRDRFDVLLITGSLVALTAIEGGLGIYQYVTKTGASYAGQFTRAVGTFGADAVVALGTVIGYGIVVTLAMGLAQRGRPRVLLLGLTGFLLIPLGLSLTRGAWIATAIAVIVMLFAHSWRIAVGLLATATLAVAFYVAAASGTSAPAFSERITSIFSSGSEPDQSVKDRYALWGAAVDIWADHPVVGVGLKDFPTYRDSYASLELSAGSDVDDPTGGFRREPLLSPHNQYLLVLSEQGSVGILAFGGLLLSMLIGGFRRRPREYLPGPEQRMLSLIAPGVMVWTMINFLYGDVGAGPLGVVLAVLLGVVARRSLLLPEPPPVGPPASAGQVKAGTA